MAIAARGQIGDVEQGERRLVGRDRRRQAEILGNFALVDGDFAELARQRMAGNVEGAKALLETEREMAVADGAPIAQEQHAVAGELGSQLRLALGHRASKNLSSMLLRRRSMPGSTAVRCTV